MPQFFPLPSRLRPQPILPVQRGVPGLQQLLRRLRTSLRQRRRRSSDRRRMRRSAGPGKLVALVAAYNRR